MASRSRDTPKRPKHGRLPAPAPLPARVPPRTPAEEDLVAAWQARRADRSGRPPKFETEKGPDGAHTVQPPDGDDALWGARLAASLGTADPDAAAHLLDQVAGSCWKASPDFAVNATLAMVHGIGPRDAAEAMLATQMVAVHNVALEQLRRAQLSGQSDDGVKLSVAHAARLLRLFALQVEALARYRGKTSEQRVTVEHVHVYDGGQAVVGAVSGASVRPACGQQGEGVMAIFEEQFNKQPAARPVRRRGAPVGNRNALKHGRYTAEAVSLRRYMQALVRASRTHLKQVRSTERALH